MIEVIDVLVKSLVKYRDLSKTYEERDKYINLITKLENEKMEYLFDKND